MPSLKLPRLARDPSHPSLKTRAAAIKASAARILRRAAPAPRPAPGSPEAIAAFHAACTEFDRRTRLGDDEARRLRIGNTLTLWTTDKVRSVISGDFSGAVSGNEALAMAGKSRAEMQELLVLTLRRDLLFEEATRDTGINEHFALAHPGEGDPVPDADEGADPTLTAIAAHKAAYAAWLPHLKATSEAIPGTESYRECEAAAEAPRTREGEAYEALIGTPPPTLAGLIALADYLPGAVLRNAVVDDDDDGLRALATVCSAVREVARPPGNAANLDLSKCSMRELARLYETFGARWHMASIGMGAPYVWSGENYSPSGQILDAECDRLARFMDAIKAEAAARPTQDEDDRDERLGLLVRHELLENSRLHPGALLSEVAATWGA